MAVPDTVLLLDAALGRGVSFRLGHTRSLAALRHTQVGAAHDQIDRRRRETVARLRGDGLVGDGGGRGGRRGSGEGGGGAELLARPGVPR